MKLILIRHADCLKEELDPSLSKMGILQAKLLAKRLYKLPITKVYVSDLNRAFQTFEEYHKLAADVPFEKTKDLREIYRVLVGGAPKEGTSPTRESDDKERIEFFIKQISSMNNNENVVLFTHGNVIKYLLARFLESDSRKIGPPLYIASASISLVDIDKDGVNIKFINNTEHLTNEQSSNSYFLNKKDNNYLA
jgi:broad specificity phosphatase PhoE